MIVDVFSSKKDSFQEGAQQEWEIRQEQNMQDLKDIQFIVYGHTHEAKRNYFSGTKDDKVQMYINTGTYLPLIQKASDGKSFTKEYQITMAFFYNKDENKDGRKGDGPTIDIWNGARRKSYTY